jgi:uncharacterized protein YgbK (DUF1537 family)
MDGGLGRFAGRPTVHIAPSAAASEKEARIMTTRSLAALVCDRPAPRTAMVTGGWTLRALLGQTGAEGLFCLGLHMPGVPVSRIVGGRWHDTTIISKSGGFGDPNFLSDLFFP